MIALNQDVDYKILWLRKQISALEIGSVLDKCVAMSSIQALEIKYDESISEVAQAIDQYVGVVNDTSSKQYEDFNTKLKGDFKASIEQIQTLLSSIRAEIDTNNEKLVEL